MIPIKLTEEQIEQVINELVPNGIPVRFLINGRNLNIETGELLSKNINVIHQIHYWKFSRDTSKKIAHWLGAKAIFSK
jgi:hypothetical protein